MALRQDFGLWMRALMHYNRELFGSNGLAMSMDGERSIGVGKNALYQLRSAGRDVRARAVK